DISNPDPTKWKGKLFYDMYNGTSDTLNAKDDWSAGQPIALPLLTSFDSQGNLVLVAASGSQDTFDLTGPNFLASLTESVQKDSLGNPDYHALPNWYLGSAVPSALGSLPGTQQWDIGERVSGPMVVFNGYLYVTTYSAGAAGTNVCTSGDARLEAYSFN